jgi:hypothetical protein
VLRLTVGDRDSVVASPMEVDRVQISLQDFAQDDEQRYMHQQHNILQLDIVCLKAARFMAPLDQLTLFALGLG